MFQLLAMIVFAKHLTVVELYSSKVTVAIKKWLKHANNTFVADKTSAPIGIGNHIITHKPAIKYLADDDAKLNFNQCARIKASRVSKGLPRMIPNVWINQSIPWMLIARSVTAQHSPRDSQSINTVNRRPSQTNWHTR